MAVNYTNLFTGLGELVERTNEYVAIYTTLTNGLSEIATDFNTIGRNDIFSGTPEIFDTFRANVLSWIGQINGKAKDLLTERESVLEQLHLNGTDINSVLAEIYRDLYNTSASIKQNTVTLSAITEEKFDGSAGGLMVDKVLDGTSSPHSGFPAIWQYNNVTSELADSEAMYVQCMLDSDSDNQTEGREQFQVFGQVASSDRYSSDNFGSGAGPTFTPIQGGSLMTNLEMEGFTGGLPNGWTLDFGSLVSNVNNNTVTFKRGVESLNLIGDGVTGTIQISQAIPTGAIIPRKRYVCGFWVQGQAGIGSGTLTIEFEGTGYTPGVTEKITMNSAALAAQTTWAWKYFYVNMPDEIPADMKLVIKVTGTLSNTYNVYIDGGGIVAPIWHNGINFAVYAGSGQFVKNDRFSLTVTQNSVGLFQTWFRKALGVQMPSSGAPTISDTLASD